MVFWWDLILILRDCENTKWKKIKVVFEIKTNLIVNRSEKIDVFSSEKKVKED